MHAHVRYENVRVPYENVLGGEGKAFEVAQRRLGGGRIHHAMRTVAACHRYFEMMCERALSRTTKGTLLADKQMVQEQIAESWIEMQEFRLLVLYTAWLIDNTSARQVRHYVSACKVRAAQIMSSIGSRATHLHGALGVSNLMPLGGNGEMMATVDGPTEVHLVTVARQVHQGAQAVGGQLAHPVPPASPARVAARVRPDREPPAGPGGPGGAERAGPARPGQRRSGQALRGVPRAHRELVGARARRRRSGGSVEVRRRMGVADELVAHRGRDASARCQFARRGGGEAVAVRGSGGSDPRVHGERLGEQLDDTHRDRHLGAGSTLTRLDAGAPDLDGRRVDGRAALEVRRARLPRRDARRLRPPAGRRRRDPTRSPEA